MNSKVLVYALCLSLGVGGLVLSAAFIHEHRRFPHGAELWNWAFGLATRMDDRAR